MPTMNEVMFDHAIPMGSVFRATGTGDVPDPDALDRVRGCVLMKLYDNRLAIIHSPNGGYNVGDCFSRSERYGPNFDVEPVNMRMERRSEPARSEPTSQWLERNIEELMRSPMVSGSIRTDAIYSGTVATTNSLTSTQVLRQMQEAERAIGRMTPSTRPSLIRPRSILDVGQPASATDFGPIVQTDNL